MKKDIILRCPIIPGYNDRKEHLDAICELSGSLKSILEINVEPYHAFGEGKYSALNRECRKIPMNTDEEIEEIIAYLCANAKVLVKKA